MDPERPVDDWVDFALPFAFGVDYWLLDLEGLGVALQTEMATYVTGINDDDNIFPNNSVLTPWLWTVGIRIRI